MSQQIEDCITRLVAARTTYKKAKLEHDESRNRHLQAEASVAAAAEDVNNADRALMQAIETAVIAGMNTVKTTAPVVPPTPSLPEPEPELTQAPPVEVTPTPRPNAGPTPIKKK